LALCGAKFAPALENSRISEGRKLAFFGPPKAGPKNAIFVRAENSVGIFQAPKFPHLLINAFQRHLAHLAFSGAGEGTKMLFLT
jgi:hypothetical protein